MQSTNPIIPGFNPDPSIIRVGEDYYIATSTFEWFPGVQIHHSWDLVNWKLITHPLSDIKKLNIRGVPDSCGVWAPCLSYDNGTFYLVYSAVKSFDGMYKDTPNFLITANDIMGPWSDPVFLDSSGFDGSMFHDSDGKKYYLSMLVDHRNRKFFGGIILQEYSENEQKLIGSKKLIYQGTEIGITEGPHLYQKDGYYYLLTAEGGTEYGHAISIARSKSLLGPYENHPSNPIISARNDPDHPLQRCGHGDFVWTDNGDCFVVFLSSRPLTKRGRCILGRETSIEEIVWKKDGWPYSNYSELPRMDIPSLPHKTKEKVHEVIDFGKEGIGINYQSLRVPVDNTWAELKSESNCLRLFGRDSLGSNFDQSLLARRLQHFGVEYAITFDMDPDSFQHMAGLVCYYNTGHYYYLNVTLNEDGKRCLQLICTDNFEFKELTQPLVIHQKGKIDLKVVWSRKVIEFFVLTNDSWNAVGRAYDGSILSDDYVREGGQHYRAAFTGSFVGFCCQDLSGQRRYADFYKCEYREL